MLIVLAGFKRVCYCLDGLRRLELRGRTIVDAALRSMLTWGTFSKIAQMTKLVTFRMFRYFEDCFRLQISEGWEFVGWRVHSALETK